MIWALEDGKKSVTLMWVEEEAAKLQRAALQSLCFCSRCSVLTHTPRSALTPTFVLVVLVPRATFFIFPTRLHPLLLTLHCQNPG